MKLSETLKKRQTCRKFSSKLPDKLKILEIIEACFGPYCVRTRPALPSAGGLNSLQVGIIGVCQSKEICTSYLLDRKTGALQINGSVRYLLISEVLRIAVGREAKMGSCYILYFFNSSDIFNKYGSSALPLTHTEVGIAIQTLCLLAIENKIDSAILGGISSSLYRMGLMPDSANTCALALGIRDPHCM